MLSDLVNSARRAIQPITLFLRPLSIRDKSPLTAMLSEDIGEPEVA